MEQYTLDRDIPTICVTATSFPAGIKDAFDRLNQLLGPSAAGRQFYGISHKNEKGEIVYKAGAEQRPEDKTSKPGSETFVIKKGNYVSIYVKEFMKNITVIGSAFQELLADPRIDPQGACIEVYENMENVRCMVRLDPRVR